jgi:eukaryotic-like serine/threonine-protein kinase
MGAVYRAHDLHFPSVRKWVAVKEMINFTEDITVRQAMIQNFEREANILATLSHPSIPRIYDFFTQASSSYLVLEFIYGENMETTLNKMEGFPPESKVVAWAIEICDVLQFLHTHQPEPIIFRDVKPANVMINQYQHVVLIDFGIAKTFKAGQRGTMMGTEGYSPPEQYRGDATPLVDIYALGASLHHLLTRRNPQLEAPFTFGERPIRQLNPAVSPELEAVVYKALQYLPEDRYQSAEAMKQALLALGQRSRVVVSAPALTNRLKVEDVLLQPVWTFDCEDEIRGTPVVENGVLYVGTHDSNLYALEAETGEFLWKYPTGGAIVGRPVASDGQIYFGSEDFYVHVISANDGQIIWNYRTDAPVRSSPRVTSEYLFVGSDDTQLHAVNRKSGRVLWRFPAGSPVRSTPFTLDNLIYFGTEDGDMFCLDLFGNPKWHFKAKRAVTSSPFIQDGLVLFGSMDGNFYAFDARKGWEVWRRRMGRGSISSPCGIENLVYTGTIDGYIHCMDITNGREVWSYHTGHQVTGSPIIDQGQVYCGSVDGNMYCLDYRSGQFQWKFNTGKPITGSPVVANHVLYFGSTDHRVYALPV